MTIKTIAICHKMLILLFQTPPDFSKSFPKLPTFCDFSSSSAGHPAHISWIRFKNLQEEIRICIFHKTWIFKFHCIFF